MSPRHERRRAAPVDRRRPSVAAVGLVVVLLAVLVGVAPSHATAQETDAPAPTATAEATLTTPVLSVRRAPELLRASVSDANIRAAVQPLIDDARPGACLAVYRDGKLLIGKDVEAPKVPASLAKVLTGSALLEGLDPASRLTTMASTTGTVSNGVVEGDLYVVGGGDPLLSTPGYLTTLRNPDQPANQFAGLADAIVAAGVTRIDGDLVGDDSRYSAERWVPTWPTNYRSEGDVGPLSALIVNDGFEGYADDPDGRGTVEPGDPPLLAVETLRTLLEERGVAIDGADRVGTAPEGTTAVAELPSFPMSELITELIDDSDNVTAELLTRELGLQHKGDGSTPAGVASIAELLQAQGLPMAGTNIVDGSGLDPEWTASCALMVAALDLQGRDSLIGQALPVAGVSGTLTSRMRGTPAEGNVQAKTGSLAAVSALAGFVTTASGSDLTFSYIINEPGIYQVYGDLDEFAATLAGLDDGPAISELEPLPAVP